MARWCGCCWDLAFIGSVCVVERLFFFHRARINVGNLLVGLSHHVRRRAFAEALHEAARAPGPVARVAHAALLRYYLPRADLRDVVQEAGQMEVPRIEKNIRAILGAALLAPLVGMLGTLLGMLETFQKVSEQGGFTGPAELSAGVFTALITSVLGLTVAVPLYLFYLYFLGRAKRLVHRIERAGIEMVHLIADAREEEEFAPFRGEVTAGKKAGEGEAGAHEMKLEMTLPERPGFLHAVPVLNIFALVQLFFLLGPSLVRQSGVAVDLPPSRFQMERYQRRRWWSRWDRARPTPRIHFGRDSVTLDGAFRAARQAARGRRAGEGDRAAPDRHRHAGGNRAGGHGNGARPRDSAWRWWAKTRPRAAVPDPKPTDK